MAISDSFLVLVDALNLDAPQGDQGWLKGEPSKQNIQPGAKGIWMSRLCWQLVDEFSVDPDRLECKGKVIRDLAIELGWIATSSMASTSLCWIVCPVSVRHPMKPLPSSTGVALGVSSSRRNLLLRTSTSAHKPIRNALTCVV